jgi:hypothetical protein
MKYLQQTALRSQLQCVLRYAPLSPEWPFRPIGQSMLLAWTMGCLMSTIEPEPLPVFVFHILRGFTAFFSHCFISFVFHELGRRQKKSDMGLAFAPAPGQEPKPSASHTVRSRFS